jgi:predicted DNA-binding transcriptional regulator YafY
MQDVVSLGLSPVARDHADAETLLRLSTAARDRAGIRLTYRSAAGEVTDRLVDPYGIAFQSGPLVPGGLGSLPQRDASVPGSTA